MLSCEVVAIRRVAIFRIVAAEGTTVTEVKHVPVPLLGRDRIVELEAHRQTAQVSRRDVTIQIVHVRRRLAAGRLLVAARDRRVRLLGRRAPRKIHRVERFEELLVHALTVEERGGLGWFR